MRLDPAQGIELIRTREHVERTTAVLVSKGYNAETIEIYPGANLFQVVIRFDELPVISLSEIEKYIMESYFVQVDCVMSGSDEIFLGED